MLTAVAVVVGAALDRTVAEPPASLHPVVHLGRATGRLRGHDVAAGSVGAAVLPAAFALAAATAVWLAAGVHLLAGTLAAAIVVFSTASHRMLVDEVRGVAAATTTDLGAARGRLRSLAGREPDSLSPGQIRSAAVESGAENLADGLVAPLIGFVVGCWVATVAGEPTLVGGAGAAAWVKGVNTLDSMLGYPDRSVGRVPARLDDAVMWVPARVSAGLIGLAGGQPLAPADARGDAHAPASPNAGWPMATMATVLGVRLEKPGRYVLPGGDGLPTVDDAQRSARVVSRAAWLAVGLAAVGAGLAGGWPC